MHRLTDPNRLQVNNCIFAGVVSQTADCRLEGPRANHSEVFQTNWPDLSGRKVNHGVWGLNHVLPLRALSCSVTAGLISTPKTHCWNACYSLNSHHNLRTAWQTFGVYYGNVLNKLPYNAQGKTHHPQQNLCICLLTELSGKKLQFLFKIQRQMVVKCHSRYSKTSLLSLVMLQRCYPEKQCAVRGPHAWWQANSELNP